MRRLYVVVAAAMLIGAGCRSTSFCPRRPAAACAPACTSAPVCGPATGDTYLGTPSVQVNPGTIINPGPETYTPAP